MTTSLKHACTNCPALAACKHTFGAYWAAKSRNGEGCDAPMTAEHTRRVAESVAAAKAREDAEKMQDDLFAAKAEAECRFSAREWIVTHMCREHETTAKTEAGAINNIRFRLYGSRPMRTLPPFSARPKRIGSISANKAAARLARLVG